MRKNLPIEVKFSRRVVEDADPYDRFYTRVVKKQKGNRKRFPFV